MSARTRRGRLLAAAGAGLAAAGIAVIVIAVRAQHHAPQPPPSAASPVNVIPRTAPHSTPSSARDTAHRPATRGPVLARSVPTHLSIPVIGVESDLGRIGLTANGDIRTPPLDKDSHAYWLDVSPTPGQVGPATILGHVDSAAYGPAVFFRLGDLRQRDRIDVTRADGTVAVFEVERVVSYLKKDFPTLSVYGNTDHAALRLITCGGAFDAAHHNYLSNIVVYASLVSSHRA